MTTSRFHSIKNGWLRQEAHLLLRVLLALLLCAAGSSVWAQPTLKQKKDQLQNQMNKLQQEIQQIESALKTTHARKKKSMSEILALQAKIISREKLIRNMNEQVEALDATIGETTTEINNQSAQVEKMKADYANMLRKSYENQTMQNELVFLLSSNSFFEAYRRYNYLLKIAEYRREQAKALQASIGKLQAQKDDLQLTKDEKVGLLQKQNTQKSTLEKEKQEKDKAVGQLQEKEKKLRQQAEQKNAAVRKLNDRIQSIIEEEIRLARKRAEEEAKRKAANGTSAPKTTVIPLTPQEQALSKDFAGNMGKLPWPVLRGHIISQFGKHNHPVLKGVIVENNGIDIMTEAGADARAVFNGTVVSIFSLPTTHNCVIIKHGEYFTVYSNLESVSVKSGQTVTTKQNIGKLYTDKADNLTKVHIEIWKGKEKMNPELWLAD